MIASPIDIIMGYGRPHRYHCETACSPIWELHMSTTPIMNLSGFCFNIENSASCQASGDGTEENPSQHIPKIRYMTKRVAVPVRVRVGFGG